MFQIMETVGVSIGAGVQSVDRTIDVLEALADVGGEATLSELAARADLPLPTTHRLMHTLVLRGYARQLPSRRYTLGPHLVRLGDVAARQLGAGVGPYLECLTGELGETTNIAILDRGMAVYLAQAASAHQMRMFTEVGRRVHTHCTGVGKAMLSQLPRGAVEDIVSRAGMPAITELSITDLPSLLTELDTIRERGFAIDDGEQEVGVRCFAVPVPGTPTPMALSVSGPAARVSYQFGDEAVPRLQAVAAQIAREITGPAPA